MSDLDIILAKEYSKRHGLYDKKSPKYKDKLYMDNAWREMSSLLGYDVAVLKDRMLQLRNRYNVEKRKFELLKSQNPNAKSPWPMFYHLNFLDGHIRQRRKGSRGYYTLEDIRTEDTPPIIKRRPGRPPKSSYASYQEPAVNHHEKQDEYINPGSYNNGTEQSSSEFAIKDEVVSNPDETVENQEHFINPANLLAQAEEDQSDDYTQNSNSESSTEARGKDTASQVTTTKRKHDDLILKLHRTPCKFQAFGQFLTASLADMPEHKALNLIEKFTIELVTKMRN